MPLGKGECRSPVFPLLGASGRRSPVWFAYPAEYRHEHPPNPLCSRRRQVPATASRHGSLTSHPGRTHAVLRYDRTLQSYNEDFYGSMGSVVPVPQPDLYDAVDG
jgi:hypothetical protein